MFMNPAPTNIYSDLGDAWVRHQIALLRQRHVQLGQRCRLDLDALLARAASIARTTRAAEATMSKPQDPWGDRLHRATIDAIDHCARPWEGAWIAVRKPCLA
jgi:hypothetical protein